jgi:hypothetical protein
MATFQKYLDDQPKQKDVLRLVNKARKAAGQKVLSRLPKGLRANARQCPLARAFEGSIFVGRLHIPSKEVAEKYAAAFEKTPVTVSYDDRWAIDLPELFLKFIYYFDIGLYPTLIEEAARVA